MNLNRLATKFHLAGALLVFTTVACGVFGVYMFARLSFVVGDALHDSQQTLDLSAELAGLLEREDDALLRAVAQSPQAGEDLLGLRRRFDQGFAQLVALLTEPDEQRAARSLGEHVAAYRRAGDALGQVREPGAALTRYHQEVNSILRKAIADCAQIRDFNFREMGQAGLRARDEALRASRVIAAVLIAAFLVSMAVAFYLGRLVIRPVLELTESVDAIRRGEFGRRVRVAGKDELGQLAEGFNRMADTLDDFRRSNLGEVLRAKAVLEATLEALPDAVVVLDSGARVGSMNRLARAVLLGSDRAPLPVSLASLPAPGVPEVVGQVVRQALSGRHQGSIRTDLQKAFAVSAEGGERRLLPIAIPDFAAGGSGAILVLHDVTEFVRLDELRGEVVAVASHELKTPLTTIRMNLMLLSECLEGLQPRQQEILATALSGCEELAGIIERLLDVARIEAGQLRLLRQRTDLRELITQVVARFRDRAEEAGVHLAMSGEPAPANVDAARIAIVLSNLLSNALKYTGRGGRVTVEYASRQNGTSPCRGPCSDR